MPAIKPIVVADGATPPVSQTYSPVAIDGAGVAKFANRSNGIAIGFPTITQQTRMPNKGGQVYRVTGKMTLPTLDVTSPSTSTGIQPAPTKAYENNANIEFLLPSRGTRAERQNLLALFRNYVASSEFETAVLDFETIY